MTFMRLTALLLLLLSMTALAQRTAMRPSGVNLFSPQQDIELGRKVAADAEKQLQLLQHGEANTYVRTLGQRLLVNVRNENKYPFSFKIVDDRSINAFALPGGPIYIHRGAIEAADNEAQLAGVMGHEIAHVLLRHGTNQATKAQIAQAPLALLGGVLGDGNAGRIITQLSGFAATSVLLKHSREAETESDLLGTQMLYDAGYDPRAMAQFFEKLAKEHKGSSIEQFFSNHPIPENRVGKVNEEIRRIGPVRARPRVDSTGFQRVKKATLALPAPRKPAPKE